MRERRFNDVMDVVNDDNFAIIDIMPKATIAQQQ
jgi:hypothetical protein